jgi:deoxyribodipyrimidine photo-lyase
LTAAIVWFRRDLRLDDLPALTAAVGAGAGRVVPLFVLDPSLLAPAGPNRRRFLAGALRALDRELGKKLVLRSGSPVQVVPAFAAEVGASVVATSADFGPYGAARDQAVERALAAAGCRLLAVDSPYVAVPGTVRSASGSPLRIFSAFRRALEASGWERPVTCQPAAAFVGARSDASVDEIEKGVASPGRHGLPEWWEGLPLAAAQHLPPAGPLAARARLESFVAGPLADYAENRDRPALAGTSGLSPYLHFGCIHPRTVLSRLGTGPGAERMRDELAWREFYADVMWNRPDSARLPLQAFGRYLRWDTGERARERFRSWAMGRTGYPLVDAGMRQLLAEGWMHNRLRMVTASFLVKDLHIDWRLGARWFMWHLVDGDLASNQHGWQWVAGTGTDAAPFHRVLNPETQRQRFDPDGIYVRRYLGEQVVAGGSGPLESLWGQTAAYPEPVVDHAEERRETLARFEEARGLAVAGEAPSTAQR